MDEARFEKLAGDELSALGLAFLDVGAHALELRLRAERPEPGRLGERIAHREALGHFSRDPCGFFIFRCRHEHPRQRRARLSRVEVAGQQSGGNGRDDIGVVQNDQR